VNTLLTDTQTAYPVLISCCSSVCVLLVSTHNVISLFSEAVHFFFGVLNNAFISSELQCPVIG
jgi:hypothetical protein